MSFCQNCGTKLEAKARFCPNCGSPVTAKINSERETRSGTVSDTAQAGPTNHVAREKITVQGNTCNGASAKNTKYREQFRAIESGKSPKFSWFSMIFGPFQQLYHKSYSLFLKTYLPPIVFMVLLSGLSAYAGMTFDLTLMGVGTVLTLVGLIWGLVVAILNGKNYCRRLYEQTNGNPEAIPAAPLAVVIGVLALMAFSVVSNQVGVSFAQVQWPQELQGGSEDYYFEETVQPEEPQEVLPQSNEPEEADGAMIVPGDTPWYGVWQNSAGELLVYERYLPANEVVTPLEDGSYMIQLYSQWDGSLWMQMIFSGDGTTLEEYDGEGNYLDLYTRPAEPPVEPLPEEWWGTYTDGIGTDTVTVDGYRYGNAAYTQWTISEDGTCAITCAMVPDMWMVTVRFDEDAQTLSLLGLDGQPYATYQKES